MEYSKLSTRIYFCFVECLHCFQCQNVSEGIDCNVVAECNNDEVSLTLVICLKRDSFACYNIL